jgi:hypothetical protein
MTLLVATTELEAVNIMLRAIGESPVNSLGGQNVDVVIAQALLSETSREVQSEGWNFNQETEWELAPSVEASTITVPGNAIRVDADTDTSVDIVLRGTKVYDKKNHTYEFDHTLKVDILFLLEWTELPECARAYIAVKAARKLQKDLVGSSELDGFKAEDEMRARARLMNEEGDTADANILTGTSGYMRMTMNRPGGRRY